MRAIPIRSNRLFLLAAAIVLAGCGGGGGEPPTTPSSIGLATSASTASAVQGATAGVTITLSRTNFTGDVALSTEGLPAGVTATFAPASLTGSTSSSVLTFTAAASATPGTSTVTVRATGSGVTTQASTVALTITATPAFALSSGGTLSVAPGASGTASITIARTNFTGAVTLAASGLPTGATASFAPNPSTTDASVMTVAGGTATPGTYTVTITGTGTGVTTRTTTVALTITAPAAADYTLTLSPAATSVTSGASGTVNVTLARTNFTGDVAFAASGLPSGATASFAPATTTGTASVLTVNTGTATAGTYTITVTGTATGIANKTATFGLTINPPGSATNVSFIFCADALPTWVGYQDGTGAWKQASAGANNTWSFSITGKGGVAIVDATAGNAAQNGYETFIYYASATELQSIGAGNCATPTPGPKTVNGTFAGLGANYGTIVLGQSDASTFGDGPFTLSGVATGPHDLLATLTNASTFNVDKLIVRRALDPASGSTLPVLDFSAAEAIAPTRYVVTFPGVSSTTPSLVTSALGTPTAGFISLSGDQFTANTSSYLGYAAAAAGDLHELFAEIAQGANDYRGSFSYFTTPGSRAAGLGPLLSAPTFGTLGATPYPRLRTQFASQTEYGSVALALFAQQNQTAPSVNDRVVQLLMTAAYTGGRPATWDLSIPDLTAATGFTTSWLIGAGRSTEVAGAAYGGDILTGTPANGTVFTFAQSYGAITSAASMASAGTLRPTAIRRLTVKQAHRQAERVIRIAHNRMMMRRR